MRGTLPPRPATRQARRRSGISRTRLQPRWPIRRPRRPSAPAGSPPRSGTPDSDPSTPRPQSADPVQHRRPGVRRRHPGRERHGPGGAPVAGAEAGDRARPGGPSSTLGVPPPKRRGVGTRAGPRWRRPSRTSPASGRRSPRHRTAYPGCERRSAGRRSERAPPSGLGLLRKRRSMPPASGYAAPSARSRAIPRPRPRVGRRTKPKGRPRAADGLLCDQAAPDVIVMVEALGL